MAMTTCYANYELPVPQTVVQPQQSVHQTRLPAPQKDYSIPLHVDCSVEYELPNQAKPPAGARIEPLLMIHPCYFRKMESQRRSPFINNMPTRTTSSSVLNTTATRRAARTTQTSTQSHQQRQLQQQLAQLQQQQQQQQQQQMSQQQQQTQYSQQQHTHTTATPSNTYLEQQQPQSRTTATPAYHLKQSQTATLTWEHIPPMPALVPIPSNVSLSNQAAATAISMYSKPVGNGKRDAMLGGGAYTTDGGLAGSNWEAERSPMAAVPRDYQAGPDTTPASHGAHHRVDQTQHNAVINTGHGNDKQHILSGKYRQYLRAHRVHPYGMGTYPQLTAATSFPQMQQISCYNV